jgi:hypothetical protein
LNVDVKCAKLKFNVFTGLDLQGLTVAQNGTGWKYPEILNVNQITLDYRLIPLVFKREISVKACIIGNGQIHLEKKGKNSNWEYLMAKFQSPKKDDVKKEAVNDKTKEPVK